MDKTPLLVFAYSDVGHACLKFLLEHGENVVTLYSHEDNPKEKLWFPSVKDLAKKHNVPVRTAETLTVKEQEHIRSLKPQLIFSFYYRNLIPKTILDVAPLGAYNMHGSLLPRYRGRAPVNWAVLHGETKTGATLHVMEAKADTGDIIDQETVPIGPDDTSSEVQERVTQAAVNVLARQIEALKGGKAPRHAQDNTQATTFGRRRPEDGRIDWGKPAREIHNLVRAVTHPYPGAYTDRKDGKTYIWSSRLTDIPSTRPAGDIFRENNRLFANCGDGKLLEILKADNI